MKMIWNWLTDEWEMKLIGGIILALVAGIVALVWVGCTHGDDERNEFMAACAGVNKSPAECRYNWATRPRHESTTTVMPVPVVVNGGR